MAAAPVYRSLTTGINLIGQSMRTGATMAGHFLTNGFSKGLQFIASIPSLPMGGILHGITALSKYAKHVLVLGTAAAITTSSVHTPHFLQYPAATNEIEPTSFSIPIAGLALSSMNTWTKSMFNPYAEWELYPGNVTSEEIQKGWEEAFGVANEAIKATYNLLIGEDWGTLTNPNASYVDRVSSGLSLALNSLGWVGLLKSGAKLAAKEIVKEAGTVRKGVFGKGKEILPGKKGAAKDPGKAGQQVDNNKAIEQNKGKVNEGTPKTNPLENIKYTDKVKEQMKQGDYHSFPESVDGFGSNGKVTKIIGGDNVVRTKVEIPGSYQGKEGIFEYIIEPDGVTCNHRLFRPNK